MKITLYKNCILTNSFSEVCDVFHKDENGKTTLDRYLDTLEKLVIDAGDVYYTNSGKFSFDMAGTGYENTDFYVFNYMKFEDETNPSFKRFCFIDNIAVVNKIAVVSYIEDVWSCYAPSMKMRRSLLTRSRIVDYGDWQVPFYSPGMEYQGNNQISFVELLEHVKDYQEVAIVLQVQLYKLSQAGTVSEREIYEFFVTSKIQHQDNFITYRPVQNAVEMLFDIITKSSGTKITWNNAEWNYEVYNATFVPNVFNITLEASATTPISIYDDGNITVYFAPFADSILGNTEIQYTVTKQLAPNFKQFKIGTIVNAFDVTQNGTAVEVKVGYFASKTDFALYLSFQNQLFDITRDFMVEFPITVQSADVTQQQATAREVANLNAKLGIAAGGMKVASGIMHVGTGIGQIGLSIATGSPSLAMKGLNSTVGAISEIGTGTMNIISQKKQLEVANRALYTTNKGTKLVSNAALVANYGIVVYEIVPDNETEVQANIDNAGYVCNEIVDDILLNITTGTVNKYNVMSFDYVNIYGAFTQRIADALREILYNGFKIWYDETAI